MAEWSNAAVLKTVDLHGSGGSNPSSSAKYGSLNAALVFTPEEGFGKPHFILLRKSAHYNRLAALRDRGPVRILTRSDTL